ncbi:protein associated with UVRAG as autophagy enhancer [Pseudochaenichthys georgianus]|uniref:protein associated with UVRAG as autophagy enhancer n=1 Tax=Pseudochaenichthys georgianus TaxID=52239 RepID=UPI00146AD240|nr:protein associated with UVRAG as autophagy enhancer [Pseudochaenichthys georgianus]
MEELQQDVSTKVIEKLCLSSSVLMGGCVDISPSEHTHRYISWCVDSAETHTPEDTLVTQTGDSSPVQRQETGSGSVPLLLLSPPETTYNRRCLQPDVDPTSHNTHADGGEEERKCLLDPEEKHFPLRRSRPILSRRFRPVSWDKTSPPLGDKEKMTSSSMEDRKSTCAIGEQGLAEGQRGRGLISRDAPPTTGLSIERSSSDIPECSAEIFRSCCDLDKENAHFVVVDLMLEVLEGVKWTMDTQQHTHPHTQHTHSNTVPHAHVTHTSYRKTHSAHTHTQDEVETGSEEVQHPPKTFYILSTDSGFEDGGVDTMQRDSLRNAVALAEQLVLEFRRHFPSQELPGLCELPLTSSALGEEIRERRGDLIWRPPAYKIIITVQPTLRRGEVVALQHFLCAGCGTELEHRYIKKLRYCDYLGRYFCECCHGGSEAVIPGRVLTCWDFNRYPVSDFSKQLLDSLWFQPLFHLQTLNSRVKELERFREVQDQLMDIQKLLNTCRFSSQVTFDQLPAHLMQRCPIFSLDDLQRLKKGQLGSLAKTLLHTALKHVESCELCLARGFICEFCREKDVIFPFQRETCRRCAVCRACFHKHCFVEKRCPKCERIKSRRKHPDGSTK